jgi:hypothetical protein
MVARVIFMSFLLLVLSFASEKRFSYVFGDDDLDEQEEGSPASSADSSVPEDPKPSSSAEDVESSQLGWPNAIELQSIKSLMESASKEILTVFTDTERTCGEIDEVVNDFSEVREQLYQQYIEIDEFLDKFYEEVSVKIGQLKKTFQLGNM